MWGVRVGRVVVVCVCVGGVCMQGGCLEAGMRCWWLLYGCGVDVVTDDCYNPCAALHCYRRSCR